MVVSVGKEADLQTVGMLSSGGELCSVEAILDNCLTELVFCGLSGLPFGCNIF